MKTNQITLSVFAALSVVAGAFAAGPKAAPRAEVTFSDPEKFTDAADGPRGSDIGRDQNLAQLRDHLVTKAQRYIPEGQKLSVTITDVDFAGEIEPWRSAQMHDVRIIKSIYAPRIDLSFKLTDAATGAVIKEGTRQLRDQTFDMNIRPDRNEARVYENGLLDDWIRSEFKPNKK